MLRLFSLFALLLLPLCTAWAECLKCEKIRKYHDEHPEENYEYFEAYLKVKAERKARSSAYLGHHQEDTEKKITRRGPSPLGVVDDVED